MHNDPVERNAHIINTAAEELTRYRATVTLAQAAVTLAEEFRKLLAMVKELEEAGLSDQAQALRDVIRSTSVVASLPPPPRPRGRPRKEDEE